MTPEWANKILNDSNILFNVSISTAMNGWNFICSKTQDLMKTPRVQQIGLTALWMYSAACVMGWKIAKHVYEQNELVRVPYDWISWFYGNLCVITSRQKFEPKCDYWISECSLIRLPRYDDDGRHPYLFDFPGGSFMGTRMLEPRILLDPFVPSSRFIESYEILTDGPMHIVSTLEEHVQMRMEDYMRKTDQATPRTDEDNIIILKSKDKYIVKILNTHESSTNMPCKESKCSFLSIEYSHPEMKDTISLEIPRSMMIAENQILSPAFVRRCLEYQSQSYVFDDQYKILLMDSTIKQYTINYKQYISISEDACVINDL